MSVGGKSEDDSDVAIKVENVSKKFSRNLKRSMMYGLKDIGRNALGMRTKSDILRKDEFWAVDDVSFDVKKGECLGIIGPNGSGKSTILKMLNGIYWPDKGKITINGKVGALIEVGAGFHPMLTGRENIYLNAAILGMKKEEVDERFDDIVKFADIGDFLDSPVKYYSSGMYVRLGFAVAVHCEPDILLIDEILSVGDSVFRNKCNKKMNEIKTKQHKAIVFVSHNLFMVEKFCDKGIFIEEGAIKSQGKIREVIRDYQYSITQPSTKKKTAESAISKVSNGTKEAIITNVKFLNCIGSEQKEFALWDTVGIRLEYKTEQSIANPQVEISLFNQEGIKICSLDTRIDNVQTQPPIRGKGIIECWIEHLPLLADNYYINVHLYDSEHISLLDYWGGTVNPTLSFRVLPDEISAMMGDYKGICQFHTKWITNQVRIIEK